MSDRATRLYETTTSFTQNEVVPLGRYAHDADMKRLVNGILLLILLFTVVMGVFVCRDDPREAAYCVIVLLGLAAAFGIFGHVGIKYGSRQTWSLVDRVWTHTTWYDGKCFHRLDEDGDEYAWPLKKIRYAWRSECTIFLCTTSRSLIPVNLLHLTETDRKSLLELLQNQCPKLIALE